MTDFAFPPAALPSVAIAGSSPCFPAHRIYCIGRNYADHARAMGADPERGTPIFFSKPADAAVATHAVTRYPQRTSTLQHVLELVAAILRVGREAPQDRA